MPDVNNPVAEPSAAIEATPNFNPSDQHTWSPEQREHWNKTGSIPEPPKTQDSAPASAPETEAIPEPEGKNAAEPGAAPKQEKKDRRPGDKLTAEARISQLTAKVRELEERERSRAADTKPPDSPAETKPTNYADWRKEFKPETWLEEFFQKNPNSPYGDGVAAMNDHMNDMRDGYREAEQSLSAQRKQLSDQLDEAKKRYPDADKTILPTAEQFARDQEMSPVIKAVLNDSPVMMDLLYVLGSKPEDLADFVETAHANPSAALRKLVLLERLVMEELEGKTSSKPEPAKKADAPVSPTPRAPKPPSEVGGRGTAPEDTLAEAARTGNFASFEAEQNRRVRASRS